MEFIINFIAFLVGFLIIIFPVLCLYLIYAKKYEFVMKNMNKEFNYKYFGSVLYIRKFIFCASIGLFYDRFAL